MNTLKVIIVIMMIQAQCFTAAAKDILIVQSSRIKPYEEALRGIKEVLPTRLPASGIKSISPHAVKRIVLSDSSNNEHLQWTVRSFSPDLIIAIGHTALNRVVGFDSQPIVYLMVPYPAEPASNRSYIFGVEMNVPPARQLEALIKKNSGIQRMGLVYDPTKTKELVKAVRLTARQYQVSLIAEEVHSAREARTAISSEFDQGIDAFWLLPDSTVITEENLASIHSLGLRNGVVILAFADKYLRYGADITVSYDSRGMGETAGELARQILTGSCPNRSAHNLTSSPKLVVQTTR